MSDTSESLTPSQENLANMNDVRTYQAIDELMQKDEQTYEEFLNDFTYLKKDDIVKQTQKNKLKETMKINKTSQMEGAVTNGNSADQIKIVSSATKNEDNDDIEEEVLDAGTTTNIMSSGVRVNASVKFDNFVDTEDLSDEDDHVEGGYISSFGNGKEMSVECCQESAKTEKALSPNEEDDVTRETTTDIITEHGEIVMPSDSLNPGEIEDIDDTPSVREVQIDRCLDFSAKIGNVQVEKLETDTRVEHTQVSSDDVEPFSLDEDFDYDNVILTPKFSVQEVDFLKSVMQQKEVT